MNVSSTMSAGDTKAGPVVEAPLTALIVEDDDDTRVALREGLHLNGFFTVAAATPADAVRFLKFIRFDCIVLDWRLGEQTGEAVVEALAETQAATPVLVTTAAAMTQPPGVSDLLRKPYSLAAVVDRCRALARGARDQRRAS